MIFIETTIFTREIEALLPDDSYRKLQQAIVLRPEAGSLIPGEGVCVSSGGIFHRLVSEEVYESFIIGTRPGIRFTCFWLTRRAGSKTSPRTS